MKVLHQATLETRDLAQSLFAVESRPAKQLLKVIIVTDCACSCPNLYA